MKCGTSPLADKNCSALRQRLWSRGRRGNLHLVFGIFARCYRGCEDRLAQKVFVLTELQENCQVIDRDPPDGFFKEKIIEPIRPQPLLQIPS